MADGYKHFFKEAKRAAQKDSVTGPKAAASSGQKRQAQAKSRFPIDTPERKLQEELVRRAKKRKEMSKQRREPFPASAFIGLAVACGLAITLYYKPELLELEVGLFGKASASPADTNTPNAAGGAKASTADPAKSAATAPSGEEKNSGPDRKKSSLDGKKEAVADSTPHSLTSEEISVFSKLSERKRQLDLREAELNKLDEELQKQKAELDEKLRKLENTRRDIASTLKSRVDIDQEKVDKLVQMYSSMKAPQAAKIIESLNEDLAVEVIEKMKKKNAADVLNVMDPKKAEKLSEILAGYVKADR